MKPVVVLLHAIDVIHRERIVVFLRIVGFGRLNESSTIGGWTRKTKVGPENDWLFTDRREGKGQQRGALCLAIRWPLELL